MQTDTKNSFDVMAFLPYLLNQAAEKTSLEFQSYYRGKYAMLRTEWRVLFHVGTFEKMTAKAIVHAAQIHKTKVSRAVQALEKKRFLKKSVDAADRRREVLFLTPTGRSVYKDLVKRAEEYEAKIAAKFSEDEIGTLRKILIRLNGG